MHEFSFARIPGFGPYRDTKVRASPEAVDGDERRTMGSTCKRCFIAPARVTGQVIEQKSAEVIVAECRG